MNKLVILYIQGTSRMGGAPESLFQLTKGLAKDRFRPIVVCSERNILTEKLKKEGISYEIIRMGMFRKGKNLPLIPVSIFRLCRLAKSREVDIIHANSLWDAPYAGLTANILKIPCVVHIRTEHPKERAKKYLLKYAGSVITISNSLKEPFRGCEDIFGKMITVYNGVDIELYRNRSQEDKRPSGEDETFIIGYVGRIDPAKGLGDLISAFSLLGKLNENARLVFVGDITGKQAEYYNTLRKMVEALNLNDRVEFTGFLEDVIGRLCSFDLLVLPSLREGFGRVLIEAMAAGVPVIGTNVGGIPEIIDDGEDGFLVPPGDPQSLKEAVKKLIEDDSLRMRFSENGIKKVESKFTLAKNID